VPSGSGTIAFLLGTIVFVLVPGPSVVFILGRAVAWGRRAALVTVVGNLLGVLLLVATVSVGIGALLERAAPVLIVLKFVGAGYLIWLGILAYRHRGELAATSNGPVATPGSARTLREGFLVGVTNPKAIVFFAAVLPQFVDPSRSYPATQMLVLGLLFCVFASTMDALWALLAGTIRDRLATSPTRLRRMGGAGGLTMIGLGIGIAASGQRAR
jgi:threonine/homoserine/homoserine lactone efflux protein